MGSCVLTLNMGWYHPDKKELVILQSGQISISLIYIINYLDSNDKIIVMFLLNFHLNKKKYVVTL